VIDDVPTSSAIHPPPSVNNEESKQKSSRGTGVSLKLPTEIPLDDGAREGTDPWREIGGVRFCHWDRWLLRLALDEPEGLRSIAREFRRRAAAPRGTNHVAEAMLAQLAVLEERLTTIQLAPAAVLDDVERASK